MCLTHHHLLFPRIPSRRELCQMWNRQNSNQGMWNGKLGPREVSWTAVPQHLPLQWIYCNCQWLLLSQHYLMELPQCSYRLVINNRYKGAFLYRWIDTEHYKWLSNKIIWKLISQVSRNLLKVENQNYFVVLVCWKACQPQPHRPINVHIFLSLYNQHPNHKASYWS